MTADTNGEKQHVTLNMSDHPGLETVQNDKGQVTQTSETDAAGAQHTTDYTYDGNGKLTGAKKDGKDVLPADARDAKVDPKTGELTYTDGKGEHTLNAGDTKASSDRPNGVIGEGAGDGALGSNPDNPIATMPGGLEWSPDGKKENKWFKNDDGTVYHTNDKGQPDQYKDKDGNMHKFSGDITDYGKDFHIGKNGIPIYTGTDGAPHYAPTEQTSTDSDGATRTTRSTANEMETTKHNKDGTTVTTKFDANERPTEQTIKNQDNSTITTKLENGNPKEQIKRDPAGNITETTTWAADGSSTKRDANNHIIEQTTKTQDGSTTTKYDANGTRTEETLRDQGGHKTQTTFWRPDGTSTTNTYDENENIKGSADWDKNGNPSDTTPKPGSGALVGNSNTHVGFNKEGQIVSYWDLHNHVMVYLDTDHHWKECGYENGRPDYKNSSDLGTKAPVLDPKTGELKAQDKNCREGRPDGVLINGVSADVQSTRAVVNGAALTVMGTMWFINTYGGFVPVPRAPIEQHYPEGPPPQRPPG